VRIGGLEKLKPKWLATSMCEPFFIRAADFGTGMPILELCLWKTGKTLRKSKDPMPVHAAGSFVATDIIVKG
jgi:hypothetical protein